MADNVMMYKYVCKNVAARHGKVVTFMPKPLFQDNGSGMHVHFSLVEGRQAAVRRQQVRGPERDGPVRDRRDPASTRRRCARSRNPTTNSYKRLVPGYEAPVNLVYSSRNRSAAIRIPMYSENPKTKRHRVPLPGQHRATPTSRSAPSRWPPSTGSRTRSTPATRWTRTSTTSRADEYEKIGSAPGSLDEALRRAGERPRLPARGRRLHRRRDPLLDQVQARERGRRHPHAAASVRVLHVLRHLTAGTGPAGRHARLIRTLAGAGTYRGSRAVRHRRGAAAGGAALRRDEARRAGRGPGQRRPASVAGVQGLNEASRSACGR